MKRALFFLLSLFISIPIHAESLESPLALFSNGLTVGRDADNQPLILCRAFLLGRKIVGTTTYKTPICILSYDGVVYSINEFSIPNKKEFGFSTWSSSADKAITVGTTKDGKPIFLCQSNFNGVLLPGFTWSGYGHCNVVYQGRELIADVTYILSSLK